MRNLDTFLSFIFRSTPRSNPNVKSFRPIKYSSARSHIPTTDTHYTNTNTHTSSLAPQLSRLNIPQPLPSLHQRREYLHRRMLSPMLWLAAVSDTIDLAHAIVFPLVLFAERVAIKQARLGWSILSVMRFMLQHLQAHLAVHCCVFRCERFAQLEIAGCLCHAACAVMLVRKHDG